MLFKSPYKHKKNSHVQITDTVDMLWKKTLLDMQIFFIVKDIFNVKISRE